LKDVKRSSNQNVKVNGRGQTMYSKHDNNDTVGFVIICGLLILLIVMSGAMYFERMTLDKQVKNMVLEHRGKQYVLIPYPYLKGQFVTVKKDDNGRAVCAVITNEPKTK